MQSISFNEACVAIIALLALIVSIGQFAIQRKHNRLSIRPKLVLEHKWDKKYMIRSIYVENVGLGPAIIKKCQIVHKSYKYPLESFGNIDVMPSILINNKSDVDLAMDSKSHDFNFNKYKMSLYLGTSGEGLYKEKVLKKNQKILLLQFDLNYSDLKIYQKTTPDNETEISEKEKEILIDEYYLNVHEMLFAWLQKINVHIEYDSLYNEKQSPLQESPYSVLESDTV